MASQGIAQTYSQGPASVGGHAPMTKEEVQAARGELEKLKAEYGIREPQRAFMEDEDYVWRFGAPPDYSLANLAYIKGKSMNHPEGSLEQIVEDIVKTWEFERSHKMDPTKHKSVDTNRFRIGANGNRMFGNLEANQVGNYNVLLDGVKPELWDPNQDWDQTHHVFKDAFAVFPWEILKCFSGPPCVSFSWRHWANFTGQYKGHQGKGELVNLYGFGTATVTPDLKLLDVNVYYNAEEFLEVMEGKKPAAVLEHGRSVMGNFMALTNVLAAGEEAPVEEEACPASGNKSGVCPFMCGGK